MGPVAGWGEALTVGWGRTRTITRRRIKTLLLVRPRPPARAPLPLCCFHHRIPERWWGLRRSARCARPPQPPFNILRGEQTVWTPGLGTLPHSAPPPSPARPRSPPATPRQNGQDPQVRDGRGGRVGGAGVPARERRHHFAECCRGAQIVFSPPFPRALTPSRPLPWPPLPACPAARSRPSRPRRTAATSPGGSVAWRPSGAKKLRLSIFVGRTCVPLARARAPCNPAPPHAPPAPSPMIAAPTSTRC
jgi:hypothetical protein